MEMNDVERTERARVVEVARSWISTPYHDNAMVKGHGVDCATLLVAVFQEAGLTAPIDIPAYSPQWHLHRGEEKYMNEVLRHAKEISQEDAQPGDVVLYRIGRLYAHGAIIVDWPVEVIHAEKAVGKVVSARAFEGELLNTQIRGVAVPRQFKIFTRW
jgi:NlpC/P60 family